MATLTEEQKHEKLPIIRVTLDGPQEVPLGSRDNFVNLKVTYEASEETYEGETPSIIIHNYMFTLSQVFELDCLRGDDQWEEYDSGDDGYGGFRIEDCPPVLVNVTQDGQFFSLNPGESAIVHKRRIKIPDGYQRGDRFRLQFKGTSVEWWDWGHRGSHASVMVYLPCWRDGPVLDPPTPETDSNMCPVTDNGGRPVLRVASCEPVEFIAV